MYIKSNYIEMVRNSNVLQIKGHTIDYRNDIMVLW